MPNLKRCGCGAVPNTLTITPGDTCKWAWVSGDCCGEWYVEFRTDYKPLESDACMRLAIFAWNDAPRKE